MTQPELKTATPPGKEVVAQYWAEPDWWNDVPEANPRCRVKVDGSAPRLMVEVHRDGTLNAPEGVLVDTYEDFPLMRDEEVM